MEPWKEAEIAYEQNMAVSYDFHYYTSPVSRAHLKQFLQLVYRYAVKGQIVLDVGGGTGPVAQRLIEQGYPRVVTVDISLAMLREAKKKLPALTAIVCDGEHIPFKADSVWTVICSSVLHHMPTPDGVLKDIKRVLAPYGMLIAQEPSKDHVMSLPTTSGRCRSTAAAPSWRNWRWARRMPKQPCPGPGNACPNLAPGIRSRPSRARSRR